MNLIHEFALIVPVALPVLMLAALNAMLALGGERGTLLLPGLRALPTGSGPVRFDTTPSRVSPAADATVANDEAVRDAA